ncbi:MAG: GlsB/YeaQ/YmgE family stress response membrane protein [Actinoallomurus sp.]
MLMTIVWFIVIGAIIGALARLVVPGPNPMGIALTILIGIVGAVLGGVIASAIGAGSIIAFIISVLVAAAGVALISGRGRWGSHRGVY